MIGDLRLVGRHVLWLLHQTSRHRGMIGSGWRQYKNQLTITRNADLYVRLFCGSYGWYHGYVV
jgi:hypothetical protein